MPPINPQKHRITVHPGDQCRETISPEITPQMLDAEIASEAYHTPTSGITVCILTLRNGFIVTGESRLFDPAAVHPDIVRDLAKGKARQKMRELLAFRLADQRQLARQRAELAEFQRTVSDETVDAMISAALGGNAPQ